MTVTIFTDTDPERPRRHRRGRRIGWALFALGVIAAIVLALVPAPYVIERPGPVFNTLGQVQYQGKTAPLIDIPTEKTYQTKGSLDLLTVNVVGSPDELPTWFDVASAWLDPSQAIVPLKEFYPAGETQKQSDQQSQVDMQNSQKEAIAAALTALGKKYTSQLIVVETEKGDPAYNVLKANDRIISINGQKYQDVTALRAAISANGTSKPATVVVQRGAVEKTFSITPAMSGGADSAPILGIIVGGDYTFPFDVKIQLDNVGGPSAGMMFALGIIDKLTPGELNGGKDVAGTGEITASGQVGPIGGIRQKMYGARNAGATYFLAPASNCNEVTGHIPGGLKVFAVKTLKDSLTALKAISSGGSTAGLPTCPAN